MLPVTVTFEVPAPLPPPAVVRPSNDGMLGDVALFMPAGIFKSASTLWNGELGSLVSKGVRVASSGKV